MKHPTASAATALYPAKMSLFVVVLALVGSSFAYVPSSRFLNRMKPTLSPLHLTTADFKNGMTMEIDGVPMRLMEFLHVKPGKGSAFVRTKIKNLSNGSVQEKTFRAGESIEAADIQKVEMQFTWSEGNQYAFMNMESFEEETIDKGKLSNPQQLVAGMSVNVLLWNEQAIDVQFPKTLTVKVAECPPNFKGNTAQGALKPATLEGGAVVNVPMFIESGEEIIIDTEEMKYTSRA